MPRLKERRKIIHEPSAQEIYHCLASMPYWAEILLKEKSEKAYHNFLRWLIDKKFHKGLYEKITIKKIATEFKTVITMATKWLAEIYNDIYILNEEKPELFYRQGHIVNLNISHYDNHGYFKLKLPSIPREYESFRFAFMKAKIGVDFFWVKRVEYEIFNKEIEINVTLKGGFVNKYREYTVDKADFQGEIGWRDLFDLHDYEIDERLKKLYRH